MNYIKKLKNLFLYAGVEKEEYDRLLPNIHEGNKLLLKIFSWLAGVMFFLLFMVSLFYQGFAAANSKAYFASGMIMLAILICVQWVVPKKPALVTILVYIFEIVLYAFGIRISMLHADRPAVSAVAFLLVSPLLFYDRPIRLSALITAVTAVFSIMVSYLKEPDIVAIDIWNMITHDVGSEKVIVKGHGSSNATAVKVCIDQAYQMSGGAMNDEIGAALKALEPKE